MSSSEEPTAKRIKYDATNSPTMPPNDPGSEEVARPTFGASQTMVKVKVSLDDKRDEFLVHKSFICFYSPYFTAAFNGPFNEGESQASELEDMCPIAFSVFVNWLYTQRIERTDSKVLWREDLLELWLLAERLLIPRLQNETMTLLAKDDFSPSRISEKFGRLYENTAERSPLRRFFVARMTYKSPKLFGVNNYPHLMLVDMFTLASSGFIWYRPTEEETKKLYHVEEKVIAQSGLRAVGSGGAVLGGQTK